MFMGIIVKWRKVILIFWKWFKKAKEQIIMAMVGYMIKVKNKNNIINEDVILGVNISL